jgi:hypothetical protein
MKARAWWIGAWVVVASFVLGRTWLAKPSLGPRFPDGFGVWFMDVTGVSSPESAADAEAVLVYAICVVVVSMLTWIGLRLARRR